MGGVQTKQGWPWAGITAWVVDHRTQCIGLPALCVFESFHNKHHKRVNTKSLCDFILPVLSLTS